MAIEVTTGLDSSQEALMHSPQVNTVWAGQDTVPVHHHIRKSGATLHKNLIIYKYTGRMKTAQRDKREQEWEQGRGMVGEGDEEKKCGGGREKKKTLSSFRPSRPPVAFQPVSFTGPGKRSTAASLTYIVCIMPLLELPGRGEGCWTLICIESLSSLSLPAELSCTACLALPPIYWS